MWGSAPHRGQPRLVSAGRSCPLIYPDPVSAPQKGSYEVVMRARIIRLAVLVVAVAVGAAACGKYSISNIRSLKAFQDANALYKKGEYSRAAQRYTDAVTLNPDLGFAYFFLGNSYDNLYKPG